MRLQNVEMSKIVPFWFHEMFLNFALYLSCPKQQSLHIQQVKIVGFLPVGGMIRWYKNAGTRSSVAKAQFPKMAQTANPTFIWKINYCDRQATRTCTCELCGGEQRVKRLGTPVTRVRYLGGVFPRITAGRNRLRLVIFGFLCYF